MEHDCELWDSNKFFTDHEIETTNRVLQILNDNRSFIKEQRVSQIFENIKQLFTPIPADERRKRRKEERNKIKVVDEDDKLITETGMYKKKEREKLMIAKKLKYELPSDKMLEDMVHHGKTVFNKELLPNTDEMHQGKIDLTQHHADPVERPSVPLTKPLMCFGCYQPYTQLHFFYHQFCPSCASLNYAKRTQTADLTGKHALITGGRIKIGYHCALMCLRANCAMVHVTTRFPKDCAKRFAAEPDFDSFRSRLKIYGLGRGCCANLRHIPSVIRFAEQLCSEHDRLDILINNAAQTIRRPTQFYKRIATEELTCSMSDLSPSIQQLLSVSFTMQADAFQHVPRLQDLSDDAPNISSYSSNDELKICGLKTCGALRALSDNDNVSASALLSQVPTTQEDVTFHNDHHTFPPNVTDINSEQVDTRSVNTWCLNIDQVSEVEMIETQTINASAPFVLCGRLRKLMCKDRNAHKYIINVSSMEGQFYKKFKASTHPHTNMSKAALNMMTRTCGADYSIDNIWMNSVDTGWVTDENPQSYKRTEGSNKALIHVPLDEIDGASRVMDPIYMGINNGQNIHSQFYKDYQSVLW
ncbi:hypothetical protein AKO1_000514 [Acrasis kona]|uniref:Oxidoreductase n=1 Tax=Acrasis kona TaxID=1008807 RepID=A0AAW2ZS61_9EUKA